MALISRLPQLVEWVCGGYISLNLTTALWIAAILFFAIHLRKQCHKIRTLPPGPWGYPILGILFSIKKEFHLLLTDFSQKYGKIFSFKMGTETIVVLSDYKIIKKAFQTRDFTARPKTELSQLLGGYGVVNSEGDLWKSQRRFLVNQKLGMRHWGAGMDQIASCINNELVNFLNNLNAHKDSKVNPSGLLGCAISNVISSIIMSTRFEHDNPQFKRFMFLFDEGFRLFTSTGAMTFLPILKNIPAVNQACIQLRKNRQEMLHFVKEIIETHRRDLDPEHPRDLVDSYLMAINERKAAGTEQEFFHGYNADEQLEQIVLDLFSAGVETLKTSLLWAILFMLHNPDIKTKVQAELDDVIGPQRLPQIEDMKDLPYTRATLYEIMRRSSVVPMGTTHATDRTVEFEGFTIPKNTHVIPLLHAVHMNPEKWDNPQEFRPERFLNSEGQVFKPENFMPFGVGQRMCLGDHLAEKELFLFFSSLLHVYDVSNPAQKLPSLRGITGVTVTPVEYEISIAPRNTEALVLAAKAIKRDNRDSNIRTYKSETVATS